MSNITLKRYTNIPTLLEILSSKSLTFLSPETWDDRNDSYYLEQYKINRNLKSILAICFTTQNETYHFWKVFTDGMNGVRIHFNKEKLLNYLEPSVGIVSNMVQYKKIAEVKTCQPDISDWPFIKRAQFEDEKEFRIIYKTEDESVQFKNIAIGLDCIERIYFNPWMPQQLYRTMKRHIKGSFKESKSIKIYQSTLVNNEQWKQALQQPSTKAHFSA